MGSTVSEIVAAAYDAHRDYPDGWWAGDEQIEGTDALAGANLAVYVDDIQPSMAAFIEQAEGVYSQVMSTLPIDWQLGKQFQFHLEGPDSIRSWEDWLVLREWMAKRGFTVVTPIYHAGNALGGCSKESGAGLTALGRRVIQDMLERELFLCVAHMSHQSMQDTIELWDSLKSEGRGRLCYTHGGLQMTDRGVTHEIIDEGNSERLISYELAEQIIERGGLVCISPSDPFFSPHGFVEAVMLLHTINMDGNGVGIGTDYGGISGGNNPSVSGYKGEDWRWDGCETLKQCMVTVVELLLAEGLPADDVRELCSAGTRFFVG